jgi:uncharacterized protein YndB with AHSA1/START domain
MGPAPSIVIRNHLVARAEHGSIATMQLHESIGALRRETELDAPRDAVWPLVAEPDALATWLADEVDLPAVAPGERGVVVEDGELRHVTIEEVEEGRRVALSWCAPGGEPSLVELTLDDLEDGRTRMVVVEIPLATLRAVAAPAGVGDLGRSRGPQMAAAAA